MKKWIALIAGVSMQIALGGVYAWSAFSGLLQKSHGLTKSQSGLIFGITIAVFTMTMIPATKLLNSKGARFTAGIGAILFSLGYLIASFSQGNFYVLLGGLGIITGIGIGMGYAAPLVVSMKWFPNNRGLVTGIAVGGFGAGAIILSKFISHFANTHSTDVLQIFRYVFMTFGPIAFVASCLLFAPPKQENQIEGDGKTPIKHHILNPAFILFCVGLFASTFAGLLIIGHIKKLAQSMGLAEASAALSISIYAVGNVFGRIAWGQIHDKIGSRKTILCSLLSLTIPIGLLLLVEPNWQMLVVIFLIGAGFGSSFIAYASSVVDYFSVDLFAKIYPICFLSYGFAALIGPLVGGMIADSTGSFKPAIIVSGITVLAGFIILALFLPKPSRESN